MYQPRRLFPTIAALAVLGLVACGDLDSTAPLQPDDALLASSGPVLIECPVATDTATTATIGALGGAVRLKGHQMSVPKLGVKVPTAFEMREAPSNYMELTVRGNDQNSFSFDRPATITIDYSRCTRSNIDGYALTVWQIDPVTKALIAPMGGVDDKIARTVTFDTEHLSTFSLAR